MTLSLWRKRFLYAGAAGLIAMGGFGLAKAGGWKNHPGSWHGRGHWCAADHEDRSARLAGMKTFMTQSLQLNETQTAKLASLMENAESHMAGMDAYCREKNEKEASLPDQLARWEESVKVQQDTLRKLKPDIMEFYRLLNDAQRAKIDRWMAQRHGRHG